MKLNIFEALREGLKKTRREIVHRIDNVLKSKSSIDEEIFEELTSILVQTDVGINWSQKIIENLKTKSKNLNEPEVLKNLLKKEIITILSGSSSELTLSDKNLSVILIVGVNGSGKTTTIAKIAKRLKDEGRKVLLAAADTFRAGAVEQLQIWAKRIDLEVVRQKEGADPSAVVYDALNKAKANSYNILIVDTAGRLHTKINLMEELKKIKRTVVKNLNHSPDEILLILDAIVGQNAISQAKNFTESLELTGIVLTKLDGTAKGGIIIPIYEELKIPIKFIGIGETLSDLVEFEPESFVEAMFE